MQQYKSTPTSKREQFGLLEKPINQVKIAMSNSTKKTLDRFEKAVERVKSSRTV